MTIKPIHIIGAGLAGSETAWQIANMGAPVVLHEMRPVVKTAAHKTEGCAELVCSNSFRSDDKENNAVGLLHEEMRRCNSLIMREGDKAAVPAGGALAVDRDIFSDAVTKALNDHPLITIERGEVPGLPPADWDSVIIATGPLTSEKLANGIRELTGEDALAFFDALAPIVHADSIDMSRAWFQSRYDKEGPAGTGKDYLNCAMSEEQYNEFINALLTAEYTEFKDWEKDTPYFEGCMPIEVMASRGPETLRFGPMKPVGLTNPHTGERAHAVVQLRMENKLGTLYNMVGFQTKMKYGEQTRVFQMIPGLENANFARLGGLHRNTFINSPKLLDESLRLKKLIASPAKAGALGNIEDPRLCGESSKGQTLRFAGQITGCEGYVESAAVGLMAGRFAASERLGLPLPFPPKTTAMGSLLGHITGGANAETFQPMNVNFGLFPELSDSEMFTISAKGKKILVRGTDKKKAVTGRALRDLDTWLQELSTMIKSAA
jgi:methylenetetrahydrofolate--tRNA-(uracil-5-)-methyltransferase